MTAMDLTRRVIVTPGVTLDTGPAATDHARPAHPADAFRAGASHVVIGRAP
jgi:orotidine-5'-phosphate decarboxylase